MSAWADGIGWMCLSVVRMGWAVIEYSSSRRSAGTFKRPAEENGNLDSWSLAFPPPSSTLGSPQSC